MLEFFRKNATLIGGTIVFFFMATMFTGTVFLGWSFKFDKEKKNNTEKSNTFASLGEIPVSELKYREFLAQIFASLQQNNPSKKISPDLIELAQLNAFNQSVQFSLFLKGAHQHKLTISKDEINRQLEIVYREYDLKDLSNLKEALKKNNYPYKEFIKNLKNTLLAQKFEDYLKAQATVTEKDLDNVFVEARPQHIFLSSKNNRDMEEANIKKLEDIAEEIKKGLSFEDAAKRYSEDSETKENGGDLNWIRIGETPQEFENVLFALEKGELAKPIRTSAGYHLIKLLDRRQHPIPAQWDKEKSRELLLKKKQQMMVQFYLTTSIQEHVLEIQHIGLRALKAKFDGDFNLAIGAYQSQISQNPSNPIPHYFLGKIHRYLGDIPAALSELEKAALKAELTPSLGFSSLYIEHANLIGEALLKENKLPPFLIQEINRKKPNPDEGNTPLLLKEIGKTKGKIKLPDPMMTSYIKALDLADNDPQSLAQLLSIFTELHLPDKVALVNEKMHRFEELNKTGLPTPNASSK